MLEFNRSFSRLRPAGFAVAAAVGAIGLAGAPLSIAPYMPGAFELSWTDEEEAYALETSADLGQAGSWEEVGGPAADGEGQFRHVFSLDPGGLRFFRLALRDAGADRLPNLRNLDSPLAANVAPFQAWTPGWVLIDVFPKARPWVSSFCDSDTFGGGPPLDLDPFGWVASLPEGVCADTQVFSSQAGHYPSGVYVLLWEGEGTLSLRWDVEPEIVVDSADVPLDERGLRRLEFEVDPARQTDLGIGIRIQRLGDDPIRNIRLIPPGGLCGRAADDLDYFQYCATERGGVGECDPGETCFDFEAIYWDRFIDRPEDMNAPKAVFHPLYAQSYRKYRAIRYMKWLRVEESLVERWEDRVALQEQPFTDDRRGFPIEYMLAFSNLLNADAYLNVPGRVDDDYVRRFARLVQERLHSHLAVFVEYGNEMFNPGTPALFSHALDQANQPDSGIPAGDSDLVKVAKFTARRSARIFEIWREATEGSERRLARTLGGFNPVPEYTLAVLDFEDAHLSADALAINGYVGPSRPFVEDQAAFDAMGESVELILQEIEDGSVIGSGSSIADLRDVYAQHRAMAEARGLDLIVYEGSNFMELDGAPAGVVETFFELNRDRRLGEAFVRNIRNFGEAGGREFFHFLNEDLWGDDQVSGARQFQDQPRSDAPVFDALMDFVETEDCWWPGCERTAP